MPKLLSRSKHEEFESNSALQIRDQKEKKSIKFKKIGAAINLAGLRIGFLLTLFMHHVDTIHPAATVHLLVDALDFCYNFLFLPILSLLIPYDFGFFCNFPLLWAYISLSMYKLSIDQ